MAVQPKRHRFTVAEYYQMADAGIFGEDDRVELLDGEIVEMAAIGSRHAACVNRLNSFFVRQLGEEAIVGPQNPVRLGDLSEPQPDLALLRARSDYYASGHPGPHDVLLIVEVADTTAAWDRRHKVPLYASAGVPEVWLVDLPALTVESYRQPVGGVYGEVQLAGPGDALSPLAFPTVSLEVSHLLV